MAADRNALTVVYADDDLLVLNKPSGLLSVPGRGNDKQDCLSARAQAQFPDALIVHRLDMATSGLMVMARSLAVQRALSNAFANREVTKHYVAVVDGLLATTCDDWNLIDLPISLDWPNRPLRMIDPVNGKASVTRWRPLPEPGAPAGEGAIAVEGSADFDRNTPFTRVLLAPTQAAPTSYASTWPRWATQFWATRCTPARRYNNAPTVCCCTPQSWAFRTPERDNRWTFSCPCRFNRKVAETLA